MLCLTLQDRKGSPPPPDKQEEEEIDIDLNDPEVADAALKIQAGFRGHQSRQKLKQELQVGWLKMLID